MGLFFICIFIYLWRIIQSKKKYDIILVTSPPLFVGITAYLLSKIKRTPFAFEVRDLWPESAIDTGVLKSKNIIKFAYWFEKFIYKKATLVNVLTPAFKEKLINKKYVPREKIIFIPNAADFSIANNLTNFDYLKFKGDLGLKDKFVITYVGAHGIANHLIQLVEVAERLQDTNVVFQLIGDGMQKPYLIEEANKRRLENVKFVDPVPKTEVFKYILASDIGTSVLKKVDTFKTIYSNKTFDYMSCKRPILLLIDGVSRELVEKASCGWYAEPENIDQIEQTIREIIVRNDLNEIGRNGFNYAKKKFDRNILSESYLRNLENCLNN
jgi:glycosyltransferase involved in cell wall biosynthesis